MGTSGAITEVYNFKPALADQRPKTMQDQKGKKSFISTSFGKFPGQLSSAETFFEIHVKLMEKTTALYVNHGKRAFLKKL